MPENQRQNQTDDVFDTSDRRRHPRVEVNFLSYLELGNQNGGVIINISQGGVALHAAEIITGGVFPNMRFRLPKSQKWVEIGGKLAWEGICQKEVGIEFTEISDKARDQIRNWIETEGFGSDVRPAHERVNSVPSHTVQALAETKVPLVKKEPVSQFEAMFPSESSLPPLVARPRRSTPSEADANEVSSPSGDTYAIPTLPPLLANPRVEPSASLEHRPTRVQPKTAYAVGRDAAVSAKAETSHEDPTQQPGRIFQTSTGAPELSPQFRRQAPAPRVSGPAFTGAFSGEVVTRASTNTSAPPAPWFPSPPVLGEAKPVEAGGIRLAGLGYQPIAFEDPTGKSWVVMGVILVALLIGGVVMSIGPGNLRDVFYRHSFSEMPGTAAPPPPFGAAERPAATPPEANTVSPEVNRRQSPKPSVPDPGAAREEASAAIPSETDEHSVGGNAPDSSATQGAGPLSEEYETLEETAEKVRQFQLEHSGRIGAVPPPVVYSPPVAPQHSAPPEPSALASASPSSTPSNGVTTAPGPSAATPTPTARASTTPSVAPGSVAISSHFQAIPGQESYSMASLQVGQLAYFPQPSYPVEAARARTEGTVALRILVDQTGTIERVRLLSGPALLAPAAINAVRQWRYRQTLLNGRPVGTIEDVAITFRLGNSAASPR